jgi:hypothetical protein
MATVMIAAIRAHYSAETGTQDYLDQLTALTVVPAHSG